MRRGGMWTDTLWNILLLAAVGYAAITLFLFLSQSRLLFLPELPSREVRITPEQIGLPYERVQLVTSDDVKLDGWFVPAEQARGTLLFFHGNAGNISHRLDSLAVFNHLGLASLIIDYRGYGRSEGRPTEEGTYRDAQAAWRYLVEQRGIEPGRIVLFGRSLGAAVAAQLATSVRPAALILESAFTSVPDFAAEAYPLLPARYLARLHYDAREYLQSVSAPVLVVHSPDDEIIPYVHGRRLFEAAAEPRQFLEIRGGHNEGFIMSGRRYLEGLGRFFDTTLGPYDRAGD